MISLGYNRLFLEGTLVSCESTKSGVVFSLEVRMRGNQSERLVCGANGWTAHTVRVATLGDRLLVRGRLFTKPLRVSVVDVTIIGRATVVAIPVVEELPVSDVVSSTVLVAPAPEVAKFVEAHVVDRHRRHLSGGRVVWVKSHTRGGKPKSAVMAS
jgi:hypothetical protein